MRCSTVREAVEGIESGREWLTEDRGRRAAMLDAIAKALTSRRDEIIDVACAETALTPEEFAPEFVRMTRTFWMFAGVVREGSWVRAAVDRRAGEAGESIGPNHDVRRMLVPLGPVAVFGASNFPLSYGVCGGDTASALAAGCPVVVKEHPAHPRLGRLLHGIAAVAIGSAGEPPGVLSYVLNEDPKDFSIAQELVQHPAVQAVGFTGSIKGGMALVALANARPRPIPVFAEMGSTNPVFVLPAAMERDPAGLADKVADAVLARVGQQCTKPGLVFFAKSPRSPEFTRRLHERFAASQSRKMLAPWVKESFQKRTGEIEDTDASLEAFSDAGPLVNDDSGRAAQTHLWGTDLEHFLDNSSLQEEAFGPSVIWVLVPSWKDVGEITLHGHLTLTLLLDESSADDLKLAREFTRSSLARAAGRIIFNGPPTGVRVAHAMVHSGPFPACNRPDTTAVGPFAIERWCRPVCFQNAPPALLPEELRDDNPRGIARFEDGVWVPGRPRAAAGS